MEDVLQALSAPGRQEVIRVIGDREMSAGEVAAHFTLTRQAVSQHLQVLKNAGLLEERRDGTRRLYRLRRERILELSAFLDSLWSGGLARLEAAASAEQLSQKSNAPATS